MSGASTITMQLARLVQPAPRSWSGKVAQVLWALRLEHHLNKQQILEQYLNRIELGQATIGVGAATKVYFGSTASEVSLGQAATVAGLAHAPSRDNPYAAPGRARRRRDRVLRRMQLLGNAAAGDIARARQEPLVAAPQTAPFRAPHFTTRVLSWLADSDVDFALLQEAPGRDIETLKMKCGRHAKFPSVARKTDIGQEFRLAPVFL